RQGNPGTAPTATGEPTKPLRLQHRTRRPSDEGLVPQNGPPDWKIGQTSFPGSSAHAAPRLRFQARQRWRRRPRVAALPRPSQHHAHGAIYRPALRPLRWFLEGLTYRGPHTRRALRTPHATYSVLPALSTTPSTQASPARRRQIGGPARQHLSDAMPLVRAV